MSNGTGPKETQTTKPPYESKDLDVHIREMFNPLKDQQEVYEKSRSRIKRREKSRDYCVYNLKKNNTRVSIDSETNKEKIRETKNLRTRLKSN